MKGPVRCYNWFKGEFKEHTHTDNQECWDKFANRCKTALYPQANNQLYLHRQS